MTKKTVVRSKFGQWFLDSEDNGFSYAPTLSCEVAGKLWVLWFDKEEGTVAWFWMSGADEYEEQHELPGLKLPEDFWSRHGLTRSLNALVSVCSLPEVPAEALDALFGAREWA